GVQVGLEVGPGRTLQALGAATAPEITWLGSQRADRSGWPELLTTVGQLWVRGAAIDWPAFYGTPAPRRVPLPTYPFPRRRCWIANPIDPLDRHARDGRETSALRRVATAGSERLHYATEIATSSAPYSDHRLAGVPVVSASSWLALVLSALSLERSGPIELR